MNINSYRNHNTKKIRPTAYSRLLWFEAGSTSIFRNRRVNSVSVNAMPGWRLQRRPRSSITGSRSQSWLREMRGGSEFMITVALIPNPFSALWIASKLGLIIFTSLSQRIISSTSKPQARVSLRMPTPDCGRYNYNALKKLNYPDERKPFLPIISFPGEAIQDHRRNKLGECLARH